MLSEEQKMLHRDYITASQIPKIMGVSSFASPGDLAELKAFPEGEERWSTRATRRGQHFERHIADFVAKEWGLGTIWEPQNFYMSTIPEGGLADGVSTVDETVIGHLEGAGNLAVGATPDFYLPQSKTLFEIKMTSIGSGWSESSVPTEYRHQVTWQMGVISLLLGVEIRKAYIGALVEGRAMCVPVQFDSNLFAEQVNTARGFVRQVENLKAGGEFVWEGETVSGDDDAAVVNDELAQRYADLSRQLKAVKAERSAVKSEIMGTLRGAKRVQTSSGDVKVSRVQPRQSSRFDAKGYTGELERILRDMDPGFDLTPVKGQYETTYQRSAYLRVTDNRSDSEVS